MTSNLHLKIIAILLAFFVWLYVQAGDKTTDKLLTIPLKVEGLPEGLAVVTLLPDQVEFYVKGPQSRLKTIETAHNEGELYARLDLRKAIVGKKSYGTRVRGANLRWLYFYTIPGPKLEVEIGKSASKQFTPQRQIIGEIEPGTVIELESGLPENVTVTGAEVLLDQVAKVIYKLKETDLVGADTLTVEFIPQDANGRRINNLDVNPPKSEILVTVRKASASREVPVVYNLLGHPPAGYTVTDIKIEPLFIDMEGSSEALKDITRIETIPVDLTNRMKDFTIPDLELVNPNEKIKLSQTTVRLDVKIAQKTAERLFKDLPLSWQGGTEQFLHYTGDPRTVDVTVRGPLESIDALTRDMIIPSVNVTDLTTGWHDDLPVSIRIMLPDITLVKTNPDSVRVHIQKREEFLLEGEKEEE